MQCWEPRLGLYILTSFLPWKDTSSGTDPFFWPIINPFMDNFIEDFFFFQKKNHIFSEKEWST